MALLKRLGKFGAGGMVGGLVGAAAGLLLAPGSGAELQKSLRGRLSEARAAGADAQFEKERELIQRFRGGVDSSDALRDEEAKAAKIRDEKLALITSA
ncbi:MAG: hypothetical protein ACR2OO_11080 [Thermomicrobiales bacterium]